MARAELKPIYERLNGTGTYHPFSANTFSDWSLEAGDTITVVREGKSYTSPVHNSTVRWAGQQQISVESTGERKRGPVAKMSASNYNYGNGGGNSYRTGGYRASMLESHIEESENRVKSSVDNLDKKLGTRIDQTDSKVSMNVGTLKYSKVEKYASKSKFPTKGNANTLYVAKDTGLNYAWVNPPGIYCVVTPNEDGEVNYLKVGEIAIAFNEQTGKTEAILDAHVIHAGKNKDGRLVTLEDLELPDWMGATDEGIVALQGNFGTLNAKVANIETITSKAITTDNLKANIAKINLLNVIGISGTANFVTTAAMRANDFVVDGKSVKQAIGYLRIQRSGDDYTLQQRQITSDTWYDVGTFSRATTLSGRWSSRKFTVTASPQGDTFFTTLVSSIPGADITWAADGYTGTAALKATIGNSETTVNVGNVSINAYQAYSNGYQEGQASGTTYRMYKAYNTNDTIYYGPIYDSRGNQLTTDSYYWFGCVSNLGGSSSASINVKY